MSTGSRSGFRQTMEPSTCVQSYVFLLSVGRTSVNIAEENYVYTDDGQCFEQLHVTLNDFDPLGTFSQFCHC